MYSKHLNILAALFSALITPAAMAAGWSANLGYNSDYIFRGIPQKSNSVFGGVDFESGGWYAGTWAADVGDGAEVDFYGAYGFEVGDEWSLGVGATWYSYTGDFDDDYKEINLSVSWKWFALNYDFGNYDNFDQPKRTYDHAALTFEHSGFYAKYGFFEQDFDGEYIEAGYGNALEVKDLYWFDYAFSAVHSNKQLLGRPSETNFVLTVSRLIGF